MKTTVKLGLITTVILTALFVVTCKHEIPLTEKDKDDNSDTCGVSVFYIFRRRSAADDHQLHQMP